MSHDKIWICRNCKQDYPNHNEDCEFHSDKERKTGRIHAGCGGNIIKKGQCSWCDKCKQYFCGCACG